MSLHLRSRLRGVRTRLVVVYLLVAAAAASAGFAVFVYLLDSALNQNVDSDLAANAVTTAGEIRNDQIATTSQRPELGTSYGPLVTVLAVYDPTGALVDAEPARLPADPARSVPGVGFRTVRYGDRTFRFLRRTTTDHRGRRWVIIVGQSLRASSDALDDAEHALFVVVPIAIALSGLGAWLLSGAALRPVDRMRADAQRLSDTGARGEIGTPGTSDSIDRLATTFNELLNRMHSSLDRQRDLVADAGHELRTPLAVLQTELELADRAGRSRDDLVESIRHARTEAARLATLSEDLLLLAQTDGPNALIHHELAEPLEIIAGSVAAVRDDAAAGRIQLSVHADGPAPVAELDPVALRRLLDNLLANALRHTPAGGSIDVHLTQGDDDVVLVVEDTGTGFPVEFLPHAFERFARAERSRSRSHADYGSGLGLSIVETLVTAHGGTVTAANRASGGARLTVRLPAHPGG